MQGKAAEQEKSSCSRRDYYLRPSRGGINQKTAVANIFEAIARVNNGQGGIVFDKCEDGLTRMKILVKKEHLKQVVEAMRSDGKSPCIANCHSTPSSASSTTSLEQRLNFMRKRHISRSSQFTKRVSRQQQNGSSWKPALHSIPEEQH